MRRNLVALTQGLFDLVIIGGGITGAGVALDAALRGLRTALIDKADFASGTSSISSKLVHGGLRYLEQGEFRLVYEALHERAHLLHNAPHLVGPLRFLIPFYRGQRVAPWQWRVGLAMYDLLAGAGNIERAKTISPAKLRRECPYLEAASLLGGALYADAQMDDARLCIEVIHTAAAAGAQVANYVEAVGLEMNGDGQHRIEAADHESGQRLTIQTRQILNATGPWCDRVRKLAGEATAPFIKPTKGVHLVAPDRGLRHALLLLHPDDGRVFFVIPWLGKTLIGTTDTESRGLPEHADVDKTDIQYLLTGVNHYFKPAFQASDLLSTFVGVRPLLAARPADPSSRSREFQVVVEPSGLISVAGGKYTTYRHMAEVITDRICQLLSMDRRCRTRHHRLIGAPAEPWPAFQAPQAEQLRRDYQLDQLTALHLVSRYGTRAAQVAAYTSKNPSLGERISAAEPDILAEFAYARDEEMACRPADFLLRRTRLGLFQPELLNRDITGSFSS